MKHSGKARQAPDAEPLAGTCSVSMLRKLKADENTEETYAAIQQGAATHLLLKNEERRSPFADRREAVAAARFRW